MFLLLVKCNPAVLLCSVTNLESLLDCVKFLSYITFSDDSLVEKTSENEFLGKYSLRGKVTKVIDNYPRKIIVYS